MAEFSLDLNEDQLQIQKWVHDFAENVIRPVAHEWDEREETPWPLIEEAARIGLYSFDFISQAYFDESGLLMPIANEEMAWGDAGIALSIFGSTLGLAGIAANGTPEQLLEWGPQCFGTPDKIQTAAFAVSEADAGSDVSSLRTRAVYDEAKDEWVINGTKTWITNGGMADLHVVVASVDSDARLAGPGQLHRPARHTGALPGAEVQEDGYPGLPHRRGDPRRRAGPGPLPARRQGQARRAAGTGPRGEAIDQPGGHEDLRGLAPDRRCPGARHRARRVRVLARRTPRSARPSARRSSRTRRSPSSSPT